jgi:HEAT repeat protein
MRFAFAGLALMGDQASPILAKRARALVDQPERYGVLHNYCKALGVSGDGSQIPLLLTILKTAKVPVVRSAAAEALVALDAVEVVPELIAFLNQEIEAGPRDAIYGAIGTLGGAAAGEWLEQAFTDWVNGEPGARNAGSLIWPALLALDDPAAVERLRQLPAGMAKPFVVKALARRAELGDDLVVAELMPFLDPDFAPGPGVRSDAVRGLIAAKNWDGVVRATYDPDSGVVIAALQGLRQEHAVAADVGRRELEDLAKNTEPRLALAATQALVERGDSSVLESILVRAREYPTGPGSAEAINFIRQLNPAPPQTMGLLRACWERCNADQRLGLLRVFGQLGDVGAVDFVAGVFADQENDIGVREMALVQLGNLGGLSLDLLIGLELENLDSVLVDSYLSALGRLSSKHRPAVDRLVEIALGQENSVKLRMASLALLPKILGLASFDLLMRARAQAVDVRETAYVNALLEENF